MSNSNPQPDDAGADELVAYLDGELPDAAARRVEQRLATDEDYRRQLGELDQAWSALEALPTPTVDDKFARTTIEMVALAAERDLSQRSTAETSRSRKRMLWFAAAGLALLVAGFAAARVLMPSQNRTLISDLPTIARIDELAQIGSLDFLRGLSKLDASQFVVEDESRVRAPELEIPASGFDDPESRRLWVEHLSADQKTDLAGRLERFQALPGGREEQRRLRQLEDEIVHALDSDQLQKTLSAYGPWLASRSPGDQAALREGSSEERLREVQKLARQTSRESTRKLSPDEDQAIRDVINKFADEHRSEILAALERDYPDVARRSQKEPKLANVTLVWLGMREEKLRDELRSQLNTALNDTNRQFLERQQPFEQSMQMMRWVRSATNPKFGPQELEQFFSEKLTNDQRERLLNLRPADMETQLERWYVASQAGIPPADWAGFEAPGRLGRPGFGPGRSQRDRENGPPGRGEGPPREPGGRRFDRDRGPGGPDGPPPGGPPRDGRRRPGPPPDDDGRQPPPDSPPR